MAETFKPAIWFPFQKWGGSLIWFTLNVQDSHSLSLRQPTGDNNREKCLSRKVFTRTVRLCPLNTPFLSRRCFSECHNPFCFAGLYTLGSFSILPSPLHHASSLLSSFLIFSLLHRDFYLTLDSISIEATSQEAKAIAWRRETIFSFMSKKLVSHGMHKVQILWSQLGFILERYLEWFLQSLA